jgi:thioredoxin 1
MITVKKFYAKWCGPCKILNPIMEEVKSEFPNNVTFQEVDIDININTVEKYKVRSVPLVVIEKDGVEKFRISGANSKNTYVDKIKLLLQ